MTSSPKFGLLVLFMAAMPVVSGPAFGQSEGNVPGQATLSTRSFDGNRLVSLDSGAWRFREGDNRSWRDPDLDDSDWDLVDINPADDEVRQAPWKGIGWFRLRILVDSTLQDQLLALQLYHSGASEVYWDGRQVGGFGSIGADASEDELYVPLGLPLSVHLDDASSHVLAVRYANRALPDWSARIYAGYSRLTSGLAVLIGPNTKTIHSNIFRKSLIYWDAALMGMLLTIMLLHFFLFGAETSDRSNLYFAFAVAAICVTHFAGHGVGYDFIVVDGGVNAAFLIAAGDLAAVVFLSFLLATIYSLYQPRLIRVVWVLLALFVVTWTVVNVLDLRSAEAALRVGWVLVMLEMVRATVVAAARGKEGARLLVVAVIVVLATGMGFLFFPAMMGLSGSWGVAVTSPSIVVRFGVFLLMFLGAFPIAMSILLSRRFAHRSRRLKEELIRVEELSEQTLAQEHEKTLLIASQNERLEAEVAQRTAELESTVVNLKATQAQLVQQEKLASLGALTAGIAHEIKNPLNFVNNFAEVNAELAEEAEAALAAGNLDAARESLADLAANATQITKHGKRADSIVRSMMLHARGGVSQKEVVDVNTFLEEYAALAWHGRRARDEGFDVELVRDFSPEAGTIEALPQDLGRVILNLLGNAFDAVTDVANARVTITSRRADKGIEVVVADNGPGIPPEIAERIFEPFFTTKPTGQGTGLGLSLSYDIVTNGHGGSMRVEAAVPSGAAFVITLPG